MNIVIPKIVVICLAPWIVAFLYGMLFVSGQKRGGGYFPPSSDRDAFWFFITFPLMALSGILYGVFK